MRVLVAEKDPQVRALVSTRLTARHYHVLEAEESEEVLRILARQSVDLLLLSTEMDRIGGRHLIERIRQKSEWTAIPIILMTEEDRISELVMSQDRGFDDFLIKPFNPLVLQLRVSINISRARQRMEANALTHLPGNIAIERVIRAKIERGEKFSILYIDINHFKAFNDRYGFQKGDDVIRQSSKILVRTREEVAPEEGGCFIGHIGGDDFIVVLAPEREEAFARKFISEFDRIILTYYNEADQKRGFIRVKNRQGKSESFPLMSCVVAACNNLSREYKSLGEISQDAAEVKSFLKSQPGSHYLRDRRSSPLRELTHAMEILAPDMEPARELKELNPIGQILLNAGLISQEQLAAALKVHLASGRRLGQVLIAMNAVKSEDVGRMLEKKLNLPYVSLKSVFPQRENARLFSFEFMKAHRVVPLESAEGELKLAMCDPFDLRTLDAVERITGFKPAPRLALEDEFEDFLERCEKQASEREKII